MVCIVLITFSSVLENITDNVYSPREESGCGDLLVLFTFDWMASKIAKCHDMSWVDLLQVAIANGKMFI